MSAHNQTPNYPQQAPNTPYPPAKRKRPMWLTALFVLVGACVVLGVIGALVGDPRKNQNGAAAQRTTAANNQAQTDVQTPTQPPKEPPKVTTVPATATPDYV